MPLTLGPIFNSQNGKVREWRIEIALYDKGGVEVDIADGIVGTEVKQGYRASYATISG